MARPKKEMSETSPKTTTTKRQPTAAERKQYMEKLEAQKQKFAESKQAFKQVRDVTKTVRQTTISSYSKDDVIRYLQNIDSYESELRGLSRYLFYRSQVYFRLIMYNATMFDLNSRYVVPTYNPIEDNDKEAILKDYYETLQVLDRMDLQNSLLPMLINNFIEDVYYGCCWIDETGIFILKIPPEYCRISGKYFTGDFSFSVDMSNYKKFEDVLEFLGEPLSSMYKAYGGDSKNKWQPMPDEYALCTKSRMESWETIVPIYSGLFIDLIGLLNLADVQAVADEQQIYKLITATIPTLSGATDPDAWSVNIDLAVDYYNKMVESLPDYVGAAITPIPLDTMRSNYAELKAFKETVEKNELHEKREKILADERYESISTKDKEGNFVNKDFAELYKNMDNYSLAELETQVKVIHSDFIAEHSTFSALTEEKKSTSKKQFANPSKVVKSSRYGKLFQNK